MSRQWGPPWLPWLTTCVLVLSFTQYVAANADQRPVVARMRAAEIEDALHVGLTAFPVKCVKVLIQV